MKTIRVHFVRGTLGATFVLSWLTVIAACSHTGGSSSSPLPPPTTTTPGSTTPPPAPVATATVSNARTKTATVVARSGEGFLEDVNGARFLHLKGSPHDRGVEYGELMGDQIEGIVQALYAYAGQLGGSIPSWLIGVAAPLVPDVVGPIYEGYFPQETLDVIQGIIEGAAKRNPPIAISKNELVFVNSLVDLGALVQLPIFKCSGLAVWGPLAKGGKCYQLRNIDLLVGSGLEAHAVAVIEKPDQGNAFLNAGWAGMLGSTSGMNEHGLANSQIWAYSRDAAFGQPWVLTNRELLMAAQNVDAVKSAFASVQRTYGSNFVYADRGDGRGGIPRGIALESTFADLAEFTDNDPNEDSAFQGQPLAIRIPNAVFRGDLALCSRIYARQYDIAKTKDPRTSSAYQNRYQQQAQMTKDFAAKGILMGADEMLEISKTIAMQSCSLQCVVYENTDLVVHVANSRIVPGAAAVDACNEPFHTFDMDYYLPTASTTLDKPFYAAGGMAAITVGVTNHGRPRTLDARVTLSGSALVPTVTIPAIAAPTGVNATLMTQLQVPPGTRAGTYEVLVELDEAGTSDTVDYSVATLTVK